MAEPSLDVQSLLESLVDAVLVLDENENVVGYNKYFESLWGFPPHARKITSNTELFALAVSKTKSPDQFAREAAEILEQREKEHFYLVELSDGRVLERFSNPRFIDGKYRGRVVSFRDITERSRAERDLRESEARFRMIFESAGFGITLFDTEGNLINANPAFCKMLGYSEEELARIGVRGVTIPGEYDSGSGRFLREMREGTRSRYEIIKRYRRKDGSVFWGHVVATEVKKHPFSTLPYGIAMIIDITQQKQAEEALRKSEQLFRHVFENSPVGIMISDRSKRFSHPNPALKEMLGYTESEFLDLSPELMTHPEDRPETQRNLEKLIAGEIPFYKMQKRYLRKDGSPVWVEVLATSGERDASGNPMFWLGMIVDISDRKRAEEERERLLQQAQDAVRARDEFIAVASHELRTPLTPLKLQIQMLRRQLSSGEIRHQKGAPELLKLLTTSEGQLDLLNQLIEEMLNTSRLNANKIELEPRESDLSEIVRRVAERHREELARSGSILDIKSTGRVIGQWDPLRLEQVISNLLTNAIKYGRGNPIELTVFREGDFARLCVRDHGIGIARENSERIFEQFERVSPIREYGGFGLGLYIARQIVLAHGGLIWVESELGKGSTFTVELPLK